MLPTFIVVMSLIAFIVWGYDKFRAILNQWRVPERWLFLLIVAGGSFGALAGMILFWHKIRKPMFWFMTIIFCLVQAGLVLFLGK